MLLFLFFIGLSPAAFAQSDAIAWQGKTADGRTIHFDPQHLKRPAILLFWATWCPYCEALMPYVQHVQDAAGKNRLDVYAIDIKEDGDPVKTLRERKLGFTLILDGDAIADQYAVKGTPGLFLVDAHGNVNYRRSGGDAPSSVEAALREKLHLAAAAAR